MERAGSRLAVALLAAAALPVMSGCASKCGSACPAAEIQIWASPGENLDPTMAEWTGPACPPYTPTCRVDGQNTCTRFGIVATAAGACDLTITFSNRPTFMVHGEFGPSAQQGCCQGFPVIGPSTVFVPPGDPPDGATDADADADASADAPASS